MPGVERVKRFYPDSGARQKNEHGLYLITDGLLSPKDSDTALLDKIELSLKGGVRFIQLREKQLGDNELLKTALRLKELTAFYSAGLIINNSIEVANKCGAHGVHLPQTGADIQDARSRLGRNALIGVSTHCVHEAVAAQKDGADFITFGPVYFTQSKAVYGKPVGIEKLKKAAEQVELPLFGLGGIGKVQIGDLLSAGAVGAGLISALLGSSDIYKATQEIITELSNYNKSEKNRHF